MAQTTVRPQTQPGDASAAVAANMRRLRRERGWTQTELGDRLGGWSKVSVSAAECSAKGGRPRAFGIDEVVLIATVFGVEVTDLLAPIPPCSVCAGEPPAGMTCQRCGASGTPA